MATKLKEIINNRINFVLYYRKIGCGSWIKPTMSSVLHGEVNVFAGDTFDTVVLECVCIYNDLNENKFLHVIIEISIY